MILSSEIKIRLAEIEVDFYSNFCTLIESRNRLFEKYILRVQLEILILESL